MQRLPANRTVAAEAPAPICFSVWRCCLHTAACDADHEFRRQTPTGRVGNSTARDPRR